MSELDEIRSRITAIEERLGMESGLRASQDRDLSDLRTSLAAANHMIQALVLNSGQQTGLLADHGQRLARIEATQTEQTTGIRQIIAMLDTLLGRET